MYRLTTHYSRRLDLHTTRLGSSYWSLSVNRFTERVYNSSENGVAHRDRKNSSGRFDVLALFDVLHISENYCTDRIRVEVQGKPYVAALKFEDFVYRRIR